MRTPLIRIPLLAVLCLLLLPEWAQAQQLTPAQAEERGVALTADPAPARASGLSLRGMLGDVLMVPVGQNLAILDAQTGDLIDGAFISFEPHGATGIPKHAILNFDGDGIFVSVQTGTAGNVVHEYALDGTYRGVFAPAGGANTAIMSNIRGIRISPDGTRLWVTVATGANQGAIAMFDMEGNYVGNFIEPGASQTTGPWDIEVRESDILISSNSPNAIFRYTLDGTFIEQFNETAIAFPQQMHRNAEGNILQATFSPPSGVHEFTATGAFVGLYTPFTGLRGVYELPNGNILVTNSAGVHEITRANVAVRTIITGSGQYIERPMAPVTMGSLRFTPPISTGLEVTTDAGTTTSGEITLMNIGDEPISFSFTQFDDNGNGNDANGHPANPLAGTYIPTVEHAKGQEPSGGPAWRPTRGQGGPDDFGYSWISSDEPGGPAFEAIDIASTGTPVPLAEVPPGCGVTDTQDEGRALVELPFAFSYYGETYNQVYVNANGHLNFLDYTGCTWSAAVIELPAPAQPNATVAPLWADLNGYAAGQILTEQLPDGRFVIQYNDWRRFFQETTSDLTFQVILSPSGSIKFQYLTLTGSFTAGGTRIGIENQDGTDGLLIATGPATTGPLTFPTAGMAIMISAAPTFVSDVTPSSGTIAPGESLTVTVDFDATDLLGGLYEGTLTIETDEKADNGDGNGDPREGPGLVYEYPVRLNVIGDAELVITPDPLDFGSMIVGGPVSTLTVTVTNEGTGPATIDAASVDNDAFSVVGLGSEITLQPGESTTLTVSFDPDEPGAASGTLSVFSDKPNSPATVTLMGMGLARPQPMLSTTSLTFEMGPDQTSTASVMLMNEAAAGAADLEFSVTVAAARPAPLTGPFAPMPAGITDDLASAGFAPVPGTPTVSYAVRGGGIDCENDPDLIIQDDGTAENGYSANPVTVARAILVDRYTPADYPAAVNSVCVAFITQTGGPTTHPFDVMVYAPDGPNNGPGTVIAAVPATATNIPAIAGAPFPVVWQTVDLTAADIVVESGSVYIGVRFAPLPSSPPNVFVAADQSTDRPIGFAGGYFGTEPLAGGAINWQPTQGAYAQYRALFVRPSIGPAMQVVTVMPESGTVAAGESQELTVMVDTEGLEPGVYQYEVLVSTNDPENPTLVLDVTVAVSTSAGDASTPLAFDVKQNYPNPFASSTAIEVHLPRAVPVNVSVYDVTGRRVATLVEQEMEAGVHTVQWDANGIAAGVYLYRVQAGPDTRTLRALVVR